MRLILLGPPGAGKGTQAELIVKHCNIPAISTGAIIRAAIATKSEFGKKAAEIINKGCLLPDDVIIGLVFERLSQEDCQNGYILDGFPRTLVQAEELSKSKYCVDKVLSIEADDDVILERLEGRRECSKCRSSYHVKYNPAKVDGVCDKCGGELIRRADDDPETIKKRLEIYHEETQTLIGYYQNRGKIITVVSQEEIEDTKKAVIEALDKHFN